MSRRRKSKFAIDFNQDPKVVAHLVLKDLLRKHPRGASGKLSSKDYEYGRNPTMCYSRSAEREGVGIYCGYTEDQIFNIFIKPGAILCGGYSVLNNAIELLWKREKSPEKSDEELERGYYWVPEATVTRRANKIRDRISYVKRIIERRGRPGVYSINTGYRSTFSDVNFYVWANNLQDAEGQFNLLTKPLVAAACPRFTMADNVNTRQHEYDAKPEDLLTHSQRTIDEMNALETSLNNQMEDIKKKLEGLRGIKEMVTEMAVNSIMVEGV